MVIKLRIVLCYLIKENGRREPTEAAHTRSVRNILTCHGSDKTVL